MKMIAEVLLEKPLSTEEFYIKNGLERYFST